MQGSLIFYARSYVTLPEAQDITVEAFVKLWRTEQNTLFFTLAQLKQWLRVTVRNACIDLLRRKQLLEKKQIDLSYLAEVSIESEAFYSETEFLLFEKIGLAIDQLDPQRKVIFKMAFLEGKTNEEIAAALHLSRQTVKNTKTDALKIVRNLVGAKELLLIGGLLLKINFSVPDC